MPGIPSDLALYVHWPWCLAKCPYCDFNAHVWDEIPRESYQNALLDDLKFMRDLTGPRRLTSVFFGGGTPSLMGASAVGNVLGKVADLWGFQPDTEVTVECNPTSSSRQLFADLKTAGVNRLSIGVQGLEPQWLEFLGRKHDVTQARATLEAALSLYSRVNADLIFGLPDQSLPLWLAHLQTLVDMGLSHLSCYQLTIEPQTHFFGAVKRGDWAPLDMDRQADFMAETAQFLGTRGFTDYEISNFSKPGEECRHNLHIWRYGDYAGVGAGAHGRITLDGVRHATQVTKHPRNYLGHPTPAERTKMTPLTPAEAWHEAILSGLRLNEGIDLLNLESYLGGKWHQNASEAALAVFCDLGLLHHTCNRIRTSFSGRMVMDSLLEQLLRI